MKIFLGEKVSFVKGFWGKRSSKWGRGQIESALYQTTFTFKTLKFPIVQDRILLSRLPGVQTKIGARNGISTRCLRGTWLWQMADDSDVVQSATTITRPGVNFTIIFWAHLRFTPVGWWNWPPGVVSAHTPSSARVSPHRTPTPSRQDAISKMAQMEMSQVRWRAEKSDKVYTFVNCK